MFTVLLRLSVQDVKTSRLDIMDFSKPVCKNFVDVQFGRSDPDPLLPL